MIRVARRLKATDVIEALCELFVSGKCPHNLAFRHATAVAWILQRPA